MDSNSPRRKKWLIIPVLVVVLAAGAYAMRGTTSVKQDIRPTETANSEAEASEAIPRVRESSIKEVIEIANEAMASMDSSLEDYTAHFTKQERSESGVLSEKTEMQVKIQSRHRNATNDAPMRIYLKFELPESTKGREVIWGKDLYEGQMAVHENTLMLSWKTIWLDPTGMLAMAGQRFPIYEIGVSKLVEKLIERGSKIHDDPGVSVTITRDYDYDGRACELMRAERQQPGGGDDDFSLAEIVYDPERRLVLGYRSFGWPESGDAEAELPLLELYEYRDLKNNVGLTDKDFDVTNESYMFP